MVIREKFLYYIYFQTRLNGSMHWLVTSMKYGMEEPIIPVYYNFYLRQKEFNSKNNVFTIIPIEVFQ